MVTLRQTFITQLQGMTTDMLQELAEVNPTVDTDGNYGDTVQKYPSSGKFYRCSVQEIDRVPGTPDTASTTLVIGNFLIKFEAGAIVPQKSQIVVLPNPARNILGGTYQTENVYSDKDDKLTVTAYCYRIT